MAFKDGHRARERSGDVAGAEDPRITELRGWAEHALRVKARPGDEAWHSGYDSACRDALRILAGES
jgi:hypothetical protein